MCLWAAAPGILRRAVACGGTRPRSSTTRPLRGADDVSTAAPIQITFDHDVDEASVAEPAAPRAGDDRAPSRGSAPRQLAYEHSTLATEHDLRGRPRGRLSRPRRQRLRAAPSLVVRHRGATQPRRLQPRRRRRRRGSRRLPDRRLHARDGCEPACAARSRSRPSVPFGVRLDPADSRRAIVAPDAAASAQHHVPRCWSRPAPSTPTATSSVACAVDSLHDRRRAAAAQLDRLCDGTPRSARPAACGSSTRPASRASCST